MLSCTVSVEVFGGLIGIPRGLVGRSCFMEVLKLQLIGLVHQVIPIPYPMDLGPSYLDLQLHFQNLI